VSALIKLARHRAAPGTPLDAPAIMARALAFLPFTADPIEARLVHGMLALGVAAGDPLWCGADGSLLPAAVAALAKALVAHKASMAGAAARGGDDDGDGDGDGGDDEQEPLFEEQLVDGLPALFAAAAAAPHAAAFAAAARALKPRQQAALREGGAQF
jgi:hypothetical protein